METILWIVNCMCLCMWTLCKAEMLYIVLKAFCHINLIIFAFGCAASLAMSNHYFVCESQLMSVISMINYLIFMMWFFVQIGSYVVNYYVKRWFFVLFCMGAHKQRVTSYHALRYVNAIRLADSKLCVFAQNACTIAPIIWLNNRRE